MKGVGNKTELRMEIFKAKANILRASSESYQIEAEMSKVRFMLHSLSPAKHQGEEGAYLRDALSTFQVALNDKKAETSQWHKIHDTLELWDDAEPATGKVNEQTPAQQLRELARKAGDQSISAFEEEHADLFRRMNAQGINNTFFWMCYKSNRDPDNEGMPFDAD